MQAVVNYAPDRGAVELRDVDVPDYGEDDVLLQVRAVGVCGSDLHQWQAAHSWPVNYPVVLGHEFDAAGFDGTAQVDLGAYEHDHRAVSGPTGLSDMSQTVGEAILRAVTDHGVEPDYDTLPARYRETGFDFVRRYATDAAYNGLEYDRTGERDQVTTYADAIGAPGPDRRLPAWDDAPITPDEVREAAAEDMAEARSAEGSATDGEGAS